MNNVISKQRKSNGDLKKQNTLKKEGEQNTRRARRSKTRSKIVSKNKENMKVATNDKNNEEVEQG